MNQDTINQIFLNECAKYVRAYEDTGIHDEMDISLYHAMKVYQAVQADQFEYWDRTKAEHIETAEFNGHDHEQGTAVWFDPEDNLTTDQHIEELRSYDELDADERLKWHVIYVVLQKMNARKP